jgi:hypothetical protein
VKLAAAETSNFLRDGRQELHLMTCGSLGVLATWWEGLLPAIESLSGDQ